MPERSRTRKTRPRGVGVQDARRLLLRLPHVSEGRSYGMPSLLLNGRFLARFRDDDTVVVLRRRPAPSPNPEPPPSAPAVEPRKSALQADAEGYYVPGYEFTVNRLRFTGFSLQPEPVVLFARNSGGAELPVACLETVIRADSVHLRC